MQKRQITKKASGIALGSSMLLLSLIPTASAFAATAPAVTSVTLTQSGSNTPGSTVDFTATAMESGSGTVQYQFWYQGVNGNWHGGSWSTNDQFQLSNIQAGSYEVVAYAKISGQTATPVSSESTYSNQFVNVDSSATLTAPSLTNVAPGAVLNFTASSKNLTNPVYQLWIQRPDGSWYASGDYQSSPNFSVTAGTAGNYHAVLYAKDLNAPQTAQFSEYSKANFDAYGQPASINLSAASSSLVADSKATDTITATIVDANGNTVPDFNGTATVTMPTPSGDTFASGTPTSVTFANGVGTFTVPGVSGSANVDYSVSNPVLTSGQSIASNFPVASGSVTLAQPSASSASVTSDLQDLSVNSQTSANITVQLLDQAGNPIAGSQLVTLNLSGQGSFAASSAQTSATVQTSSADGSVVVPVYDEQGVPGTITVSASVSGMTGGSVSIPTYETTAPASLGITGKSETLSAAVSGTAGSFPSGTPYTVYTVDLLDQNGHVITSGASASGSATISDNATTTSGNLVYYSLNSSGQPSAQIGTSSASFSESLASGQYQFAVFTQTAGSASVSISVNDTTSNVSGTTTYSYSAGPAAQSQPNAAAGYTATVPSGSTRTFTYQLQDSNGNMVTTAGVPVDFYFASDSASATLPNGASPVAQPTANPSGFTAPAGAYVVDTNSSGQASVTVTVPSTVSAGLTYQLAANIPGGIHAAGSAGLVTVNTGTNIVTSVGVVSGTLSGTMTAGASPTATVVGNNAVSALASGTTDEVTITTSNNSVVSLASGSGWTLSPSGNSVVGTLSSGVLAIPSGVIVPNKVGSATLTISDASNPSVPSVTESVTVQSGPYDKIIAVAPSNAVNGVLATPSSNAYGPFTIEATDSQGNVLGAPEAITVPSTTVEGMVSGSTGVTVSGVRTSVSGNDVSSVVIPAGQTSVIVYLDTTVASGSTNPTITAYSATSSNSVAFSSVVPVPSSITVSTTSGTTLANVGSPTVSYVSGATIVLYDVTSKSTVTGTTSAASSGTTVTFSFSSGALTSGDVYDLQSVSGVTYGGNGEVVVGTVSGSAS